MVKCDFFFPPSMLALSGSQMEKTNTVRNINICQEFISEHIFSNAGTLRLSDENI